jgi:type VI secretion system protein ImpA
LCISALKERTKDLRLAVYLTEAGLRLDGFAGFRDCLKLTTELLRRFWDLGLYPEADGDDLDFRASPLHWINERAPASIGLIPITARAGSENFGYVRYQQALQVGTEASIALLSAERRETVNGYIRQGWIRMDQFEAAVRDTRLNALESIVGPFNESNEALIDLEKVTDEKFGVAAPSFSSVKEIFSEIRKILLPALRKKQQEERGPLENTGLSAGTIDPTVRTVTAAHGGLTTSQTFSTKDWEDAEAMVRSGKVDAGLAQMAALAARETCGRGRFLRKLMLSEVCLNNGRDRMARTLLEELNGQITEFKLDRWESSEVIGPVWTRLYRLYRKSEESSEQERSRELYTRLCSLDPWQAYLNVED